jgi:hypothetical protein
MRPHKSAILIALVALLLTALVAVMAQTPAQDPAKSADKKTESSCCSDGSCPMMKKEGATANTNGTTASADMKHDCCGDSCNMKKEGAANADSATASADMKNADMKDDCCGNSCDMANHAKDAKHDMKHASDGSCCKAKMKDAKQKDAKDKVN